MSSITDASGACMVLRDHAPHPAEPFRQGGRRTQRGLLRNVGGLTAGRITEGSSGACRLSGGGSSIGVRQPVTSSCSSPSDRLRPVKAEHVAERIHQLTDASARLDVKRPSMAHTPSVQERLALREDIPRTPVHDRASATRVAFSVRRMKSDLDASGVEPTEASIYLDLGPAGQMLGPPTTADLGFLGEEHDGPDRALAEFKCRHSAPRCQRYGRRRCRDLTTSSLRRGDAPHPWPRSP